MAMVLDIPRHPAKFSDGVMEAIAHAVTTETVLLGRPLRILDPFAGTGRIHTLEGHDTVGVELEPEWAAADPRTLVGDATALPFDAASFDVVVTSPCYGNRMADHHDARDASRRNTYTHALGRKLTANSAGALQWGVPYKALHAAAWAEAVRVLRPRGLFVLNISNHIRGGQEMPVAEFHIRSLFQLGFHLVEATRVATPRLRFGANHDARVDGELVVTLRLTA